MPAEISGRFLVDHSVWARLSTTPIVRGAFETLVNTVSPTAIMMCPPVAAEFGFSARNGADHTRLMGVLRAFPECSRAPTSGETLAIQNALWNGGLLRAVGAIDTLIASYAMANDATVLHYDSDFEHVAKVVPGFKHRWIVPRGVAG